MVGMLLQRDLFRLRLYISCLCVILLSFLFLARIPYYEVFHATFNQMIFNTLHEDLYALLETTLKQYQLVPRSLGAIAVASCFCYLMLWLLKSQQPLVFPFRYIQNVRNRALRSIFLAGFVIFAIFVRFGGSLTYAYSIHWENSAVTRDNFLNEAILDDMQAIYRAYSQNTHLQRAMGLNVNSETIRDYGNLLADKAVGGNTINQYLKREASGPVIQKPRHIFLIVGESYANWPLWPRYKELNIANGLKSIIERDDSAYVPTFLPAGSGTITSINGIVTGLEEVNLSPNYQPESYKGVYETALAPQLKKLGYETHFWYGGFYSWQRLKDFTLAQGFEQFHAANDFAEKVGNAWGVVDRILFNALQSDFKNQHSSFHLILTTSNHPPYTIDPRKEGFQSGEIGGLPPQIKLNDEWVNKLGHFWYADKHIATFITTMRQRYPDALFIITADHSDRMSLESNPDLFTRYSIPLVLHGQGIHKNILPQHAAGSHIDILPTIMELIAPKGFVYYSMGNSLTSSKSYGANHELWITSNAIGKIGNNSGEPHMFAKNAEVLAPSEIEQAVEARRALSWWRIMRGNTF